MKLQEAQIQDFLGLLASIDEKSLTHRLEFDIGKLLRAFHRPFLLSDLLRWLKNIAPQGTCVCVYPALTNRQ
jgi:hypothetical protein